MSLAGKSLAVLTPMYGNMAARNWIQSFVQLQALCARAKVDFNFIFIGNESLIERARNRCVDEFLKKTDATHALFIDADIGFFPDEVLSMLELDLDVCGAACTKKSLNWLRVQDAIAKHGPVFSGEQLSMIAGDFVVNWNTLGEINFKNSEPFEVKHLGTGLLMIKREVFLKFREEYPDRWYDAGLDPAANPGPIGEFFKTGIDEDTQIYLSEDYGFCMDCQKMGSKIWLCPWVRTTHMGSYEFKADLNAVGAVNVRV